jgi:hypothetical protein
LLSSYQEHSISLVASMARAGATQNGVRRGSSWLSTTVMSTPKHGGLQRTDGAVTTCRLPQRYCGVQHNPRQSYQLLLRDPTTKESTSIQVLLSSKGEKAIKTKEEELTRTEASFLRGRHSDSSPDSHLTTLPIFEARKGQHYTTLELLQSPRYILK